MTPGISFQRDDVKGDDFLGQRRALLMHSTQKGLLVKETESNAAKRALCVKKSYKCGT